MLDAAELGPETLQLTARGEEARGASSLATVPSVVPALLLFADSEKLQRKPSNHEVRDHYTLGTQQHTSLGVSSNCKPWRTHVLRFFVSTEIV